MVYHNICHICKRRTHQHSQKYCVIHVKDMYIVIAQGSFLSDFETALSNGNWFCKLCMERILPLNHIDDDNEFMKCIEAMSQSPDAAAYWHHDVKISMKMTVILLNTMVIQILIDVTSMNIHINYSKNCKYYMENSFNKYLLQHNISDNSFSVLHLNIRSIPGNLSAFLAHMDNLDHSFSVIGLWGTWLNPCNVSGYGITGYDHVFWTRYTGRCGGVSLFVSEQICVL